MESGKTLMQAEQEKKRAFTRAVSAVASIPVLAVGVGLLYFATIEEDLVYLFLYVALGLTVTLFGFVLLLQGGLPPVPRRGKKYAAASEIAATMKEEAEAAPEVPANECPNCGAEIVSAGKFCGSCGKSLSQ